MTDKFTFGPLRLFVPVCIRHPHGFQGGPAGYEEREATEENRRAKPIIVERNDMPDPTCELDKRTKQLAEMLGMEHAEVPRVLDAAIGEIEALRFDSRRLSYLVENHAYAIVEHCFRWDSPGGRVGPGLLVAAIDAAMAETKGATP